MTQQNPIHIEEEIQEVQLSSEQPSVDRQLKINARWGAILLTLVGIAFFIFAINTVSFTDPEDYILVGFPLVMAGLGGASIYLIQRNRIILGSGIVLALNLLVPLLLTIIVADTFWSALAYAVFSSALLIWRTLPRSSWRWPIIATSVSLVVIIIVNIINSPNRLGNDPRTNTFVTFVIAVLFIAFFYQAVTQAWNRSYTIGRKLLIAFGVLGLLSLAVGLLANFGLSNVTNAYDHALEVGGKLRVTSLSLSKDLSTARRHEDDFLLRWTEEGFNNAYTNYALANQETVVEIRRDIASMFDFADAIGETFGDTYPQTEYTNDLNTLRESVDTYERNFQKVVQLTKEKGFQDEGLEGELRDVVHSIENRIYDREGLEPLVITMLSIRRNEKDYLLRGDQTYVDQTHEAVAELKRQISASDLLSVAEKTEMRSLADQYVVAFDALVEKDFEIAVATQEFNFAADTMEPIVEKLANTGAEMSSIDVSNATTANVRVRTITTVVMVIALLAAAFISVFLSRQISQPVNTLTSSVSELEKGNYDVQAEVTSADEIGTLANAFNSMANQLKASVGQIAERAKALEVSADISRQLTSILDPQQLAAEVVSQVQTAFDYYYAQIYLFDETGENLVLSAGTGDAGAEMMKRGHKLPKGQGLVGRAAESKESILVSDTTQDPDWLPNELLPDTKAETAVPIIVGDKVLGVLDVQDDVKDEITSSDVDLLESLAGQVAVALQNAESYARAEAALQEAKSLVEHAAEGIAILDLETELWAEPNENFARTFGMTLEEMVQTGPKVMSPPTQPDRRDSTEKAIEMINTAMEKGSHRFEWVHIKKDGSEFDCEIGLVRLPGDRPRLRQSILDITERKQFENLTAQRAQQQEAINLITQRIQSATTIEEAMQVAARELGHALGQKQTVVALEASALGSNGNTSSSK